MALDEYRRKRNLSASPEPKGEKKPPGYGELHFVIQKHQASHMHFDLRFESEGTLKSWAVPKGLPLHFSEKHLAIQMEDHPISYKDFEGVIPEGNYGAGTVMVWDEGEYKIVPPREGNGSKHLSSQTLFRQGIHKGHLHLLIKGKKIKGHFSLVRTDKEQNLWLIINKNADKTKDISIFKENQSVKTGRTMEEIAQKQDISSYRSIARLLGLFHLEEGPMPDFIPPMLATMTDEAFDRKDWIFEIKWDGYRCLTWKKGDDVKLFSRNRQLYNDLFPQFLEPMRQFPFDLIFDGEIVALDQTGQPNFQLLQNYHKDGKGQLIYYVFDLLYIQYFDLRNLKLSRRKEILRKCLFNQPENLRYNDDIPEQGKALLNAARENNIEGIIAKNGSSHYAAGKRTLDWLKIKTFNQQEAIICGFTQPKGSRKFFGALILGVKDRGQLRYIGHAGGGFDEILLESLYHQLKQLVTSRCPFAGPPATNAPTTWVKPQLVCEIKFAEWTKEGLMRQPVFIGLRDDKLPQEVTKETPVHISQNGLRKPPKLKAALTHLEKIYWPKDGITKGQMIDYYQKIADLILRYIKDRPQSLRRHPNGILSKGFFHKNMRDELPDWTKTVAIDAGSHGIIHYLLCQDRDSLAYINNLGCIEINPWHSRVGSLGHPDYVVLDLDPVEIGFHHVVEVALAIKDLLDELKIAGCCKTSGGRGLHVYIPLKQGAYNFEHGKHFAHLLAAIVHSRIPKITSLERMPANRRRKVYIDYLQNNEAQTLVAPYSLRPRDWAPVSTPLEWSELTPKLDPLDFNIHSIHDRIRSKGDIWLKLLTRKIDINKVLKTIEHVKFK